MRDFSILPRAVITLIVFFLAITVLPQLMAPYATAILILIALMVISWLVSKANRSKQ